MKAGKGTSTVRLRAWLPAARLLEAGWGVRHDDATTGSWGGGRVTGIMGVLNDHGDGSSLAGAAVRLDSGRRGTLTDSHGRFTIKELAPWVHPD